MSRLWVDDLRPAPPGWTWAKSSAAAIELLDEGEFAAISLDHDLGGEDTTRPVVLWLCEHDRWPEVVHVSQSREGLLTGHKSREGVLHGFWARRYGPGVRTV